MCQRSPEVHGTLDHYFAFLLSARIVRRSLQKFSLAWTRFDLHRMYHSWSIWGLACFQRCLKASLLGSSALKIHSEGSHHCHRLGASSHISSSLKIEGFRGRSLASRNSYGPMSFLSLLTVDEDSVGETRPNLSNRIGRQHMLARPRTPCSLL